MSAAVKLIVDTFVKIDRRLKKIASIARGFGETFGRATESRTTGSTARGEIRRGERLPDTVEVEEFPETVYREAPSLREYRYIHRENPYLVDPGERRVIEEID